MAMMKRYMEVCREMSEQLSEAYNGMEHDELVGRVLALRVIHDESRTEDVMLYYLALKELLRDEGFLEHEALEDPEELLRAFANEAEMEEEST